MVYAPNYQSETNVVILVSQLNKRKAYTVLTVPHKCQSEVIIRISSAKTRRRSHIQLLCLWRRQFCFSLGDNRRKINQSLQKMTLDHQVLLQVNFVMFILTSQDEYCVKVSDSLIELPCLTWNSSFLYIWSRTRVI